MRRPCPSPWCRDGLVSCKFRVSAHRSWVRVRACPTCQGAGWVDEDDEDLRTAGVVVWDRTDEDFRSSPTHWRG